MAKCTKCGKSIGFFATTSICDECSPTIIAESERLQSEREQQRQMALEEFNRQKENLLLSKFKELKSKIENGEQIFLYDSIYVPVDSIVNEEALNEDFSISILRKAGLQGWEVVGILPRTVSIGLTNRVLGAGDTAISWGAGLGGNVMGVHIILKMEMSRQNLSDDFLMDYITRNIDSFLTANEAQMLSDISHKTIK